MSSMGGRWTIGLHDLRGLSPTSVLKGIWKVWGVYQVSLEVIASKPCRRSNTS